MEARNQGRGSIHDTYGSIVPPVITADGLSSSTILSKPEMRIRRRDAYGDRNGQAVSKPPMHPPGLALRFFQAWLAGDVCLWVVAGSVCVPPQRVSRRKGHRMKIRIRYDEHTTTIDVPEEDFAVMVKMDYEDRLAKADDPAYVAPRTPQEIMDERFNRPDYNNWQKHWRHIDDNAIPPRLDHRSGYLTHEPDESREDHHYSMDEFPDLAAEEAREQQERDQELRAYIRKRMKPDYAMMLIAIHMDGLSVTEYAGLIGEERTNVSHRLQRAEKKFQEIFQKRPI